MARVRKTQQGARMFFREDSRREGAMRPAEYSKRDSIAFIEYCDECMEKHNLQHGRLARQIGLCNICGKDGFIFGRLERSDDKLNKSDVLLVAVAWPCERCGKPLRALDGYLIKGKEFNVGLVCVPCCREMMD